MRAGVARVVDTPPRLHTTTPSHLPHHHTTTPTNHHTTTPQHTTPPQRLHTSGRDGQLPLPPTARSGGDLRPDGPRTRRHVRLITPIAQLPNHLLIRDLGATSGLMGLGRAAMCACIRAYHIHAHICMVYMRIYHVYAHTYTMHAYHAHAHMRSGDLSHDGP